MNNLINKIVNLKDRIDASPFSIIQTKFFKSKSDVSDFFTFRLDEYETIFIAENSLALLTAETLNCHHVFHFFDENGSPCGIHKVESEDFHYKLPIDVKMTGGNKFGGFTHHVRYSEELLQKYQELLDDLVFQHRGYSGFRKDVNSGYSYVHGNFGGICLDNKQNIRSFARIRERHTFSPQFIIKPNYRYDLIFSNPVDKEMRIKFILIDGDSIQILKEARLNAYATYKLVLDRPIISNCNIAWETNLPVGRCVIFEYNNEFFDVFHS